MLQAFVHNFIVTYVQLLLVPFRLCEQLIKVFLQLDAIQLEHPSSSNVQACCDAAVNRILTVADTCRQGG